MLKLFIIDMRLSSCPNQNGIGLRVICIYFNIHIVVGIFVNTFRFIKRFNVLKRSRKIKLGAHIARRFRPEDKV